ncbi:hypothetical protein ACH0AC_02805 [Micrococcus luteus]|uniref:hypothetical protein n=1 Tax=Micrococcus luteus TaxID=1270 RepID=UPI00387A5EB4
MLSETGARCIKAIIEDPAQGPDVARRLLESHADGAEDVPTLAQCLDRYVEARAVRCSEGTLAGYRPEAARAARSRVCRPPRTPRDHRLGGGRHGVLGERGHAHRQRRPPQPDQVLSGPVTRGPTAAAPCGHERTGGRRGRPR